MSATRNSAKGKGGAKNDKPQKQKNSPLLPAFLVAIISIAAVNIFAPDTVATIYAVFTIPFRSSLTSKALVPPFDVVDIPGRGKGVIANRDIKQGELLIKEKPLFTVPTRPGMNPSELIRSTVAALPSADQTAFFALSYAKPNVSAPTSRLRYFRRMLFQPGKEEPVCSLGPQDSTMGAPRLLELSTVGEMLKVYWWCTR